MENPVETTITLALPHELLQQATTLADALGIAREAFITSASGTVMPVVAINKVPIGNGHPGELTLRLRSIFHQVAELSR